MILLQACCSDRSHGLPDCHINIAPSTRSFRYPKPCHPLEPKFCNSDTLFVKLGGLVTDLGRRDFRQRGIEQMSSPAPLCRAHGSLAVSGPDSRCAPNVRFIGCIECIITCFSAGSAIKRSEAGSLQHRTTSAQQVAYSTLLRYWTIQQTTALRLHTPLLRFP